MPVHAIPTHQGRVIHWCVDNGCAVIDGRLYCVSDNFSRTFTMLSSAVQKGLLAETILWPPHANWPPLHHYRIFNFQGTLDAYPESIGSVFFVTERAYFIRKLEAVRYLLTDTINPAFRRLQRWFKGCAWKLKRQRQERCLAVGLGLHARIGENSKLHALPPEVVQLILLESNRNSPSNCDYRFS